MKIPIFINICFYFFLDFPPIGIFFGFGTRSCHPQAQRFLRATLRLFGNRLGVKIQHLGNMHIKFVDRTRSGRGLGDRGLRKDRGFHLG